MGEGEKKGKSVIIMLIMGGAAQCFSLFNSPQFIPFRVFTRIEKVDTETDVEILQEIIRHFSFFCI